jgi:hypothetical protein
VTNSPDKRPPMAVALQWVSIITTVSLEMVLPGLAGYWLDKWLNTHVVFMLLGFAGGGTLAMWHLIRITKAASATRSDSDAPRRGPRR